MSHYLFVVTTLGGGGAERVVSVLASELAETEKITILAYYKALEEYERSAAVNVVYMTTDEQSYAGMNYYRRLTSIRKLVRKENPDFVIPFLSQVCMQVTVALAGTKHKVIQTVRNNPANMPASKIVRAIRDLFIWFSYKTIVQNQSQKEYFNKALWKKIYVMPNPVRTDLLGIQREAREQWELPIEIISVGRLDYQKNYEMLIKAFKQSEGLRQKCHVRIFGDGPIREELENRIKENELNHCIELMGRSTDMKTVYSSADIFVMTSSFEGMPNALMEAMASGLPCISTNCPTGPSDLIGANENGILVPVDDVLALCEALLQYVNDHETAVMLGEKARKRIVQMYTPEIIASQFVQICDSPDNRRSQ